MKKTIIVIFYVLSLFMLFLIGSARAYNAAYTHTLYQSSTIPTIDGTYIVDNDWIASGPEYFGTNAIFHDEWTMTPNLACLLIETADDTNDADDKWIICYDSTENGGTDEPDGGAAPTQYDYKLEVTGHGTSETVEWYKGDGSGWTSVTPGGGLCTLSQSLTATPKIEEAHYVLELYVDKADVSLGSVAMGYNWAQFVSYYDATTQELQQWPPADATPPGSPEVPDSWGYITYESVPNPNPDIPEGIGIIAIITLSSVATTGAVLLRKRTK